MKNLIVFGLVAACAVLMSAESVLAVGGGGGKQANSARMVFNSTVPAGGIGLAVYVRAPGEAIPSTLGALRSKLIYLNPGETRQTKKLKNGSYQIFLVNSAITAGNANTPVDINMIPLLGTTEQAVNGFNRTFNVNAGGITPTN